MRFVIYITFFILIVTLTNSCVTKEKLKAGSSECVDSFFSYCVGVKDTIKQIKLREEPGSTELHDSLCYHVRIRKTATGKIDFISIENYENHLWKFKEYHLNGKLKAEGYSLNLICYM